MKIKNLSLRQFRNIPELSLSFETPVTIFVGDNGQGKSNILESIHLLLTGASFRPAKTEHFINTSTESSTKFAFVKGQLENDGTIDDVEISVTNVKSIKINDKKVSSTKLMERYSSIHFSPESLQSIKGGPDLRRQLIDELTVFLKPETSKLQNEFKKSLRARNRLLKTLKELSAPDLVQQQSLLRAVTEKYLELATAVTLERLSALEMIKDSFLNSMRDISGMNSVDTSVEYVISEKSFQFPNKNQVLNVMHNRLLQLGDIEVRTGVTLVGPHKHDIRFIFNGSDARYYASQGQQRALILAFKMAQMMYHRRFFNGRPILLLDDVFSELDSSKRNYLVETLRRSEAQTLLTTTDYEDGAFFEDGSLKMFEIENGHVNEKVRGEFV